VYGSAPTATVFLVMPMTSSIYQPPARARTELLENVCAPTSVAGTAATSLKGVGAATVALAVALTVELDIVSFRKLKK